MVLKTTLKMTRPARTTPIRLNSAKMAEVFLLVSNARLPGGAMRVALSAARPDA